MFSIDNLSQIHSDIHIPVPLTTPPYVNGDEESLKVEIVLTPYIVIYFTLIVWD